MSPNQGVVLHIEHRQEIKKENIFDKAGAWARAHRVNAKFDRAKIQAQLHLDKLGL